MEETWFSSSHFASKKSRSSRNSMLAKLGILETVSFFEQSIMSLAMLLLLRMELTVLELEGNRLETFSMTL